MSRTPNSEEGPLAEKHPSSTTHDKSGEASLAPAAIPEFREGGLVGWLTVLGASLALFSTFGAALSFGVYQDYYTRVFLSNYSPSQISWIGSTQLFLDFSTGLPTGRLYDAGYFRHLMAAGTLLYLFSSFMLSITEPNHYYQVFLCQGVGMGIGLGLIIVPALSIPTHYFRARRSLAMGIIFAGSSVGGVVFPILINNLVNGKLGFAWGIRATSFLMMGLLLISNVLMTPRYVPRPPGQGAQPSIWSLFRDGPYMIAIAGSSLIFWGLFFPYFYLQLFSVLKGVDETLAFYSLTVLNGATILGRTLPNAVSDKYGPMNVAIPMTTVAGGLIFAMLGVRNATGMYLFAAFYGFFSGAFVSLLSAIFVGFSRSMHEIGSRIGVGMSVIGFALLTGTPITGALLDVPRYEWTHAIIFAGVVILAGVGLLVLARQLAAKTRKTWKL